MTFPIYVTSKGRPQAPTFDTLDNAAIPFKVIVEPQEHDLYAAAIGSEDLLVLADNGRGLAYARQFALDHARAEGHEWYWMLDDDISGFYDTDDEAKKCVRTPPLAVLNEAAAWATVHRDCGIVALEYQQFAWNATGGKATFNSYTDVATIIRTDVFADYREELPLKVDRDFTLQVLASGVDTARLRWLSFSVPTNGSNKGGQHDVYDSLTAEGMRREEWASRRLAELWPGIVEYKVKPNGRPDAKIHWRRMRSAA